MDNNKPSFVLNKNILTTVEKLPDDMAGKLFKHILNYVNDNNQKLDDLLLEIAFEPIKQSLMYKYRYINNRPTALIWVNLRNEVFERDNFTCVYCGKKSEKLECDHIIPVSKGGNSDITNLATSCVKCNRSKGSKLLNEWSFDNG